MKDQKITSPSALFALYVSQNIFAMLGVSCYVMADTYFVSKAGGTAGIATLNLILPVYSLIFGIGAMIGTGAATRFAIYRAEGSPQADSYYSNAMLWACLAAIPFMLIGALDPARLLRILGADDAITAMGEQYMRIILLLAPTFLLDAVTLAFVRNDGSPTLAMLGSFFSSMFNIVGDYYLIFSCGMGMTGAALATALSPLVCLLLCSFHFFMRKNTMRLRPMRPSLRLLGRSCQLGISAFVAEMAAGISIFVLNALLIRTVGTIGVSAYGVVANVAIVANAIYNGITQGSQPLLSTFYGSKDRAGLRRIRFLSLGMAACLALVSFLVICCYAYPITMLFNTEENMEMTSYATLGLKEYFFGYFFAGLNIVNCGYFSAVARPKLAFAASLLRGLIAPTLLAVLMAALWGIQGIWFSFAAAEALTLGISLLPDRHTSKAFG